MTPPSPLRCPTCGDTTQGVAAGIYYFKRILLLDNAGRVVASRSASVGQAPGSQPHIIPPVQTLDMWFPIFLLVAILVGSFIFGWAGGLLVLIGATVYVHVDSTKSGIKGGRSLITFFLAMVGLPLYSSDLYKLRDKQKRIHESRIEEQRDETKVYESDVGERVFCHYCGHTMPSDAMFCRKCGRKQILV